MDQVILFIKKIHKHLEDREKMLIEEILLRDSDSPRLDDQRMVKMAHVWAIRDLKLFLEDSRREYQRGAFDLDD